MQQKIDPLAVTVKETQRLLGCCHVTVYNLIGTKTLVARKLGRRTLITMESIHRLFEGLPAAAIGREGAPASYAGAEQTPRQRTARKMTAPA